MELIPPRTAMQTRALHALCERDPAQKVLLAKRLHAAVVERLPDIEPAVAAGIIPGRPDRPLLVTPSALKRRSLASTEGRAVLIHALAHIEFNAINLALDAASRFVDVPKVFVTDWIRVASEEALHFELLSAHLDELGFQYGDFPAHDGLWEMAERTQDDVLARMALVPRTLEARGLDASPAIRDKLRQAGDVSGANIVQRILDDEIGHVAIGNQWFRYFCAARGVDPMKHFAELCVTYRAPTLRSPFNVTARQAAGFTPEEIAVVVAADEAARLGAR